MKSRIALTFMIISLILSGCSSINNSTVRKNSNKDKEAEQLTVSNEPTPEQTIESTQVPTIIVIDEPVITNSPDVLYHQ